MIVQDIIIYTIAGVALEKTIVQPATIADFDKQLCDALDNGGAMLDTIDGTKLIINTAAISAVEICKAREAGTSDLTGINEEISPPVEK